MALDELVRLRTDLNSIDNAVDNLLFFVCLSWN